MKWVKYYDKENVQDVVGKTVSSFRMREDNQDFEFVFSDGSELRIFGRAMYPSFLANVQGEPRREPETNLGAAKPASAPPPCSAPTLFAFDPFLVGSGFVIVILSIVALIGLIRLYRDLGRDLKRLDSQIALGEAKINLRKANKQHNHGE